jgi:hypothetical protein
VEVGDLVVEQPLELLAANLVLHPVECEEVRVQRLGRRLVLGVVVGLQVRVLEALANVIPLAGVD